MKNLLPLMALLSSFSSYADCWVQAGERYGIEPELLQAIAIVESGLNAQATNTNHNGTTDYGLMQINSIHLSNLKKYNITTWQLLNDPCHNVMTGAWILAGNIRHFGYSWDAVGAYNAGYGNSPIKKSLRQKYIDKIVPHYNKLKNATLKDK